MDKTKNEDYKSVLISSLIAIALLAALLGLPAIKSLDFLILAMLVLPPLFAFTVASGGYVLGALAMALCFAVGYALDNRLAVILAAICVPFAFAAGYAVRARLRLRHSVMASGAAALAGVLLGVGALWLMTGQMPVDFFANQLEVSFSGLSDAEVLSLYQLVRIPDLFTGAVTQAALDSASRADAVTYLVGLFREALNYHLVGMIGCYSLLMGLTGYLIPRALRKKLGDDVVAIPPFAEFSLPRRFWLAFALSYLFAIIGSSYGWPGFAILEVTVLSIYGLVLSVQELAFLDFLYQRNKMGKGVRVVLHALGLIISSMLGNLLMWLGLFENIANLRVRMDTKGGVVP